MEMPLNEGSRPAGFSDLVICFRNPKMTAGALVADQDASTETVFADMHFTWRPSPHAAPVECHRKFSAPSELLDTHQIRWYLDEFASDPKDVSRAHKIEKHLAQFGYDLFRSVFPHNDAIWFAFNNCSCERRISIQIDAHSTRAQSSDVLKASAFLLNIPWELLHDGVAFLADGIRGVLIRRTMTPDLFSLVEFPKRRAAFPVRILFVCPRPEVGATYYDHRAAAAIVIELSAEYRGIEVSVLQTPTLKGLAVELKEAWKNNMPFDVVHFDGHGIYDRAGDQGVLIFEDPSDAQQKQSRRRAGVRVSTDELAGVLRDLHVPLVVIDSCQTAMAGSDPKNSIAYRLLSVGAGSVVAMSHSVLSETSLQFSRKFYRELALGQSVGRAFYHAQSDLRLAKVRRYNYFNVLRMHDWFVPVLYQSGSDLVLFDRQEVGLVDVEVDWSEDLLDFPVLYDSYGFAGRSVEILAIERALIVNRFVVVLGMSGEGKTALAKEVSFWLYRIGRFSRAVFIDMKDRLLHSRMALISRVGNVLAHGFGRALSGGDGLGLLEKVVEARSTLIVVDSCEYLLGSVGSMGRENIREVLNLFELMSEMGDTRVIFTSTESLPDPFSKNEFEVRKFAQEEAVGLLFRILQSRKKIDMSEFDADAAKTLLGVVDYHAQSVVLAASEIENIGFLDAAENIRSMAGKHGGERGKMLTGMEFMLRKLSPENRLLIDGLAVFQCGGHTWVMNKVLGANTNRIHDLDIFQKDLVANGIAQFTLHGHMRIHPAISLLLEAKVEPRKLRMFRVRWIDAMCEYAKYIYEQKFESTRISFDLAVLDLNNLVALLEWLKLESRFKELVDVATKMEEICTHIDRPQALRKIVEMRAYAARSIVGWGHMQFQVEAAKNDRMVKMREFESAESHAEKVLEHMRSAGAADYPEAAVDMLVAQFNLGRAQRYTGKVPQSLGCLRGVMNSLDYMGSAACSEADRLGLSCLIEIGECLLSLGRYHEAVIYFEGASARAEAANDERRQGLCKGKIGTAWLYKREFSQSVHSLHEALLVYERLGESDSVAATWHQIGRAYHAARSFLRAEECYKNSYSLSVQCRNRRYMAVTLNQLGNIYTLTGYLDKSLSMYRQAIEISKEDGDLKSEGDWRANIASSLALQGKYKEARVEIGQAMRLHRNFGQETRPWKKFGVLFRIEHGLGNYSESIEARKFAIEKFRLFREAGGENHSMTAQIVENVYLSVMNGQSEMMRGKIKEMAVSCRVDTRRNFLAAIYDVLGGKTEVDEELYEKLDYESAVELELLLKKISNSV